MENEKKKFYVKVMKDMKKSIKPVYYNEIIEYSITIISKNNICCSYRPILHSDDIGIYYTNWEHGHYFTNIKDAKNFIKDKFIERIKEYNDSINDCLESIDKIDNSIYIML